MEKIKKLFKDKEKNKKIENLIAFLVILIITLIIINSIIKSDENTEKEYDYTTAEFASSSMDNTSNDLEERLEKILSKISGVSNVSVLVTYSSSTEIEPVFNEKNSTSVTEEVDTSGGTRTIESEDVEKTIVSGSDSSPIIKQSNYPKIEGAIVTASGVNNTTIKSNIILAVEAVTGLATHKIQVFEANN